MNPPKLEARPNQRRGQSLVPLLSKCIHSYSFSLPEKNGKWWLNYSKSKWRGGETCLSHTVISIISDSICKLLLSQRITNSYCSWCCLNKCITEVIYDCGIKGVDYEHQTTLGKFWKCSMVYSFLQMNTQGWITSENTESADRNYEKWFWIHLDKWSLRQLWSTMWKITAELECFAIGRLLPDRLQV